jgi:hypothetical protein
MRDRKRADPEAGSITKRPLMAKETWVTTLVFYQSDL